MYADLKQVGYKVYMYLKETGEIIDSWDFMEYLPYSKLVGVDFHEAIPGLMTALVGICDTYNRNVANAVM